MGKASVACAIIAKDAAATIGDCLDSIVPYVEQVVVCVDETTTDKTAAVALAHGAKVVTGLRVSDWHECPQHGRVLAQHFAEARNASFRELRRDVDWWLWLDSDDIIKGAEHLAEFLAHVPAESVGVWLPYHYSQVAPGATATIFDRERLLRTGIEWEWQHRVHEIVAPKGLGRERVNWSRCEDIAVYHQEHKEGGEGHKTDSSARRNILLLEIDLEADPNDQRTLFYLGNQYFALSEWSEAAYSYERSTESDNVYQVWQALVYASMAYEKLGDLAQARHAAYRAMDVVPGHPEPYWRLGAIYTLVGDAAKAEFWTRLGDKQPDPPFFVFRNPLDRTFNARLCLAQVYQGVGRIQEARRELELAQQAVPGPVVNDGIAYLRKMEEATQRANGLVRLLQGREAADITRIADDLKLGEDLRQFGRVRDVIAPALLAQRPNTQPRIVFWCGQSVEPWAPPVLNERGIGGSETAVIQVARLFQQDGWRVDVYNNPDRYEGEYEGVGYWELKRLDGGACDAFVSWRQAAITPPSQARVKFLWCHDLNQGPQVAEAYRQWDRVLGVSQWHANYLAQVYGLTNTDYVPNGIDLARFAEPVQKVPWRCVYASSPDRGLQRLLRMWPSIIGEEQAELHIAYGWDTIDRYIALGQTHLAAFKAETEALIKETPRVVWRGRLPQNELAKLYQESYAWLFPTSFLEVSCISAMEALAGGCVPVTSAAGALPETIGTSGLVVTGNPDSPAWAEFSVSCARAALASRDVRLPLAAAGPERAKELSWSKAYERWRDLVGMCLEWNKLNKELAAVG